MTRLHWTYLDPSLPAPVEVGDIVCAEAGGLPLYRVMALEAGRVWVRPDVGADPRAVPLEHFRWKARAH